MAAKIKIDLTSQNRNQVEVIRAKTQWAPRSKKPEKLETRNPKQIQIIKNHKISNQLVSEFKFWISDFSGSVCFGFRASDFGF